MGELPPGFRFYPTEEELVSFYLRQKIDGTSDDLSRVMDRIIPVLDIYEFSPWELPQFAGDRCNSDPEQWFFFIPRQESEARGGRPRRLTTTGYWKATGSPGPIYSNNRSIGIKRTMVFYEGRAPAGKKTEWKMNEYKAIQGESSSSTSTQSQLRHEFSLCRVYKKTKNTRAFDRRPVGVMHMGGDTITRSRHSSYVGNYEATNTTSHHQNPSSMVVERTTISSPESSSSAGDPSDGANPSRTGNASGNVESTSVDDPSFFDWRQFDFTYDGQDFN